ncbi:hypothetical protein EC988_009275, partial [Linderina pennispora]
VWNAFTGEEIVSLAHNHIVKSADFVDAGNTVVTGGQDKQVRLFDLARPDSPTVVASHESAVRSVRWAKNHGMAVSADDRHVQFIDLRSSAVVRTIDVPDAIANISLTGDGKLLSCAAGKRILAWDVDSLKVVKDVTVDYDVSTAAVNPQRTRIVTGGKSDLLIRSYDFATEKQLETHKGHHGPVHDACFSPDGEIYATGSEDGTVRLWQSNPGTAYGLWQLRKI